jgi:hypothetical protein
MAQYVAGTLVTVTGTFTNIAGAVADPTTVVCKWSASGTVTVTTPSVTKVSTGVYTAIIDTTSMVTAAPESDAEVQVIYEFIGTGACQTGGQAFFQVTPLPF